VVERKIGRAGGVKQRTARQREWDRRYGEGRWAVGYVVDGTVILHEQAVESVYNRSYEEHFAAHPEDLKELIRLAKSLRNPHAEATTGVDLQVPAILAYLERHRLQLEGAEVVDIGSWKGQASHAISIRLSALHIQVTGDPKKTLEQFWQERKCLAMWEEGN
jgi:flavorubredoxin